jgi:heme exporter protein C
VSLSSIRWSALVLSVLGVGLILTLHWMVFFWVPNEAQQGVVQRIFYVHVPSAWTGFLAVGISAFCGAVYLWLRDERLDMAAVAAAEGGFVFLTVMLITGPLWARIAWGTFWTWEPRLTLSLLLWMVVIGYFMVRGSAESQEAGRRLSAVLAVVAAALLPLIHLSVFWFRSLHPRPVVLKPEGPTLDARMGATLGIGLVAFTVIFFALFLYRYGLERLRREAI